MSEETPVLSEKLQEEELNKEAEKLGVTDENKQEFFKCFLANKPYEETFQLFDGQTSIVLKSLTTKETNAIFNQLRKDERNLVMTNDPVYAITLSNYRIGCALKSIDSKDVYPEVNINSYTPKDDSDSYVKFRSAVLDDWNVFKVGAVSDAFNKFEAKQMFLTNHIQTKNFWKAVK